MVATGSSCLWHCWHLLLAQLLGGPLVPALLRSSSALGKEWGMPGPCVLLETWISHYWDKKRQQLLRVHGQSLWREPNPGREVPAGTGCPLSHFSSSMFKAKNGLWVGVGENEPLKCIIANVIAGWGVLQASNKSSGAGWVVDWPLGLEIAPVAIQTPSCCQRSQGACTSVSFFFSFALMEAGWFASGLRCTAAIS